MIECPAPSQYFSKTFDSVTTEGPNPDTATKQTLKSAPSIRCSTSRPNKTGPSKAYIQLSARPETVGNCVTEATKQRRAAMANIHTPLKLQRFVIDQCAQASDLAQALPRQAGASKVRLSFAGSRHSTDTRPPCGSRSSRLSGSAVSGGIRHRNSDSTSQTGDIGQSYLSS